MLTGLDEVSVLTLSEDSNLFIQNFNRIDDLSRVVRKLVPFDERLLTHNLENLVIVFLDGVYLYSGHVEINNKWILITTKLNLNL